MPSRKNLHTVAFDRELLKDDLKALETEVSMPSTLLIILLRKSVAQGGEEYVSASAVNAIVKTLEQKIADALSKARHDLDALIRMAKKPRTNPPAETHERSNQGFEDTTN